VNLDYIRTDNLKILQQTLKARTLPANELDLTSLLHEDAQPSSKSLAEVA
jgi:hypothetical protein